MVSSHAKVMVVREERLSAVLAFLSSLGFCARNLAAALGQYLVVGGRGDRRSWRSSARSTDASWSSAGGASSWPSSSSRSSSPPASRFAWGCSPPRSSCSRRGDADPGSMSVDPAVLPPGPRPVRDRGDGGHDPRRRRPSPRPHGERLLLGEPPPAARARLHRPPLRGQRRDARERAFRGERPRRGPGGGLAALRRPRPRQDRGLPVRGGTAGLPLVPGALAHVECRVRSFHDEGDHTVWVGEVRSLAAHPGGPSSTTRAATGGSRRGGRSGKGGGDRL